MAAGNPYWTMNVGFEDPPMVSTEGPVITSIAEFSGGTGTLLRTIATFNAQVRVHWTSAQPGPYPAWWSTTQIAALLFVAPPGIVPGPDYMDPFDYATTDVSPVCWGAATLTNVYENYTNRIQTAQFSWDIGQFDVKAQRKVVGGQIMYGSMNWDDGGFLQQPRPQASYDLGYYYYVKNLWHEDTP